MTDQNQATFTTGEMRRLALDAPGSVTSNLLMAAATKIDQMTTALEDAQCCILGETPEDCTADEARQETLEQIRKLLNG